MAGSRTWVQTIKATFTPIAQAIGQFASRVKADVTEPTYKERLKNSFNMGDLQKGLSDFTSTANKFNNNELIEDVSKDVIKKDVSKKEVAAKDEAPTKQATKVNHVTLTQTKEILTESSYRNLVYYAAPIIASEAILIPAVNYLLPSYSLPTIVSLNLLYLYAKTQMTIYNKITAINLSALSEQENPIQLHKKSYGEEFTTLLKTNLYDSPRFYLSDGALAFMASYVLPYPLNLAVDMAYIGKSFAEYIVPLMGTDNRNKLFSQNTPYLMGLGAPYVAATAASSLLIYYLTGVNSLYVNDAIASLFYQYSIPVVMALNENHKPFPSKRNGVDFFLYGREGMDFISDHVGELSKKLITASAIKDSWAELAALTAQALGSAYGQIFLHNYLDVKELVHKPHINLLLKFYAQDLQNALIDPLKSAQDSVTGKLAYYIPNSAIPEEQRIQHQLLVLSWSEKGAFIFNLLQKILQEYFEIPKVKISKGENLVEIKENPFSWLNLVRDDEKKLIIPVDPSLDYQPQKPPKPKSPFELPKTLLDTNIDEDYQSSNVKESSNKENLKNNKKDGGVTSDIKRVVAPAETSYRRPAETSNKKIDALMDGWTFFGGDPKQTTSSVKKDKIQNQEVQSKSALAANSIIKTTPPVKTMDSKAMLVKKNM